MNREEPEGIKSACYELPKEFENPNVEVLYTNNTQALDHLLTKTPSFETTVGLGKVQARVHISTKTTYAKVNGGNIKKKTNSKLQLNETSTNESPKTADEHLDSRSSYLRVNVVEQLKDVHEQLVVTNKLEKEIDKLHKDLALRHSQYVLP